MLPYDYARCNALLPDHNCKGCKRWAAHEDQTWGERTPQHDCVNSMDEHCLYIPIKKEDK
jgi:hypothetical protein